VRRHHDTARNNVRTQGKGGHEQSHTDIEEVAKEIGSFQRGDQSPGREEKGPQQLFWDSGFYEAVIDQ
jgi:hypothetical protein